MNQDKIVVALSVCLLAVSVLGGCQTIEQKRKIDYKSTRTLPPLEVPPDLSNLPGEKGAPGTATASAATFSEFAEKRTQPFSAAGAAVLPEYPNVRLVRDAHMRWLVVRAPPEAVWTRVREFVLANGLLIAKENPVTGVIETEWAENRAKVGSGTQRVISKWFGGLYSTGTRDKFRIRIERGADAGTTDVYLAHQGMEEVVALAGTGDSSGVAEKTLWQPSGSDPGLEAEMLRLLMAHLGAKEPEKQIAAAAQQLPEERARLRRDGRNVALLSLEDSLDRAWRRVGLSLDRIGFTVEDRDRSKGVYYVRYIDPEQQQKKGFWSRMFSGEEKPPQDQFQIRLEAIASGTQVEVLTRAGEPEQSKTGDRILSLLYEQLK